MDYALRPRKLVPSEGPAEMAVSRDQSGIARDQFCNPLARVARERVRLHEDIKTIIERRVVA